MAQSRRDAGGSLRDMHVAQVYMYVPRFISASPRVQMVGEPVEILKIRRPVSHERGTHT